MIVSVSRRTDIPAFYSDWFLDKVEQGFLYVMNPFNRKQVSKIELNPDTVDCFVFWTKNAAPIINKLHMLDERGFQYYFQFTITPYDSDIEAGIPDKQEVIRTFIKLAHLIGKEKVIWRYDPILLSSKYTKEYHYECFEEMCKSLCGSTEKCIISFLDMYTKTAKNTKGLGLSAITSDEMYDIAASFAQIAHKYRLHLETCSEAIDLSALNIQKGKCIDEKIIERILGCPIDVKKDDTQREVCGCVKSIDIGQYNTCRHYCAYCYANYNHEKVMDHCKAYDAHSLLLMGELQGDENVTIREMRSIKCKNSEAQLRLHLDS